MGAARLAGRGPLVDRRLWPGVELKSTGFLVLVAVGDVSLAPVRAAAALLSRGATEGLWRERGSLTSARGRPLMPTLAAASWLAASVLGVRFGGSGSLMPILRAAARERRGCAEAFIVDAGRGRARKTLLPPASAPVAVIDMAASFAWTLASVSLDRSMTISDCSSRGSPLWASNAWPASS